MDYNEEVARASERVRDIDTERFWGDEQSDSHVQPLSDLVRNMPADAFAMDASEMLLCYLGKDEADDTAKFAKLQELIADAAEYRENFDDIRAGFFPIAAAITLLMLESASRYKVIVEGIDYAVQESKTAIALGEV